MKRYELSDLNLTEKGYTHCFNCPLEDSAGVCTVHSEGKNKHLFDELDCNRVVVRIKAKQRKEINLPKLLLILAICFASVIVYLCVEVFFNIAITVFNETRLTIAEVCLYGVVACMALFFITKKW